MKKLFKSKKFLVSLAGTVAVALSSTLGIPEDALNQVAGIVIAYVMGQGLADFGKESK